MKSFQEFLSESLTDQLQSEIDKQLGKDSPKHKVKGFRQNAMAPLLYAQKDKQNFAIRWRQIAIDKHATKVKKYDVTYFSATGKSAVWLVFVNGNKEVLAVEPKSMNRGIVDLEKTGETFKEYSSGFARSIKEI